jgi:hypothetical protein
VSISLMNSPDPETHLRQVIILASIITIITINVHIGLGYESYDFLGYNAM